MSKERPIQMATYKGYEIQATPNQLTDSGEWEVSTRIFHDLGNEMRIRQFAASNSFKTRDEAVVHCFTFGSQIIDGKFENCNVDGL